MSEVEQLSTYGLNGMVERYLDKVIASATRRGLKVFYARQLRKSRFSGRQYYSLAIVAVEDNTAIQYASVNRRGAVSWYEIQEYYRSTYELQTEIEQP